MLPILISQTSTSEVSWMAPLVQLGVCGAVLIWFMFRCESRMKSIESALDRQSRAVILLVITFGSKPSKDLAESIQGEISAAEQERHK